jgi:chitin disaccharide deacetylase
VNPGLLIVNADDWGLDARTNEVIAECFRRGRITGASGMVWMEGSEGAARLSGELALPVGLHVNLTSPYTAAGVPADARARQRRLAEYLTRGRWRRALPNPLLQRQVKAAIEDQLGEFLRLYGRQPTHFDGERHIHTWATVLASRALPAGARVRLAWTHERGEKPAWKRALRAVTNAYLRHRFVTTSYFHSIREIDPAFGGGGIERRIERSRRVPVEVMVHPGWDDEREYLLSEAWEALLPVDRLGSYAELGCR